MALMAVTGAAGHVGGNLVRALLEQGHQVRVLVHRDDRAVRGLPVEVVRGSLEDARLIEDLIAGVGAVFHLAAQIAIGGPEERLVDAVNVAGTRNVVAACEKLGTGRLVHFSSVHALSARPDGQPVDERRPLVDEQEPAAAYDRSKARGQRLVLEAVARGLDAVVLHPTAIIGPHDHRPSAMGTVLLDLYHGRLPAVVEGGFDWVDVRDVAAAAIAAATRGARGESYLVSGSWLSLLDLARRVEALTGRRAPRFEVPMLLARMVAPVAARVSRVLGLPPRLTPESLKALREHRHVRSDKAVAQLGYRPRPLDETLADTFAWFAEHGMLGSSPRPELSRSQGH